MEQFQIIKVTAGTLEDANGLLDEVLKSPEIQDRPLKIQSMVVQPEVVQYVLGQRQELRMHIICVLVEDRTDFLLIRIEKLLAGIYDVLFEKKMRGFAKGEG
jgi:hypothetical protein